MAWFGGGDNAPKQSYGSLGKRSEFRLSPTGYICIVTNVGPGIGGKISVTFKVKGGDGGTSTLDVYPTEQCYL